MLTNLGVQMNSDLYNLANSDLTHYTDNWGTGIILQHPDTGKILLAKRTDTQTYGSPGGKVEYLESPKTGVIRECKEESNIDINDMCCYGTLPHTSPSGKDWVSFLFYSNSFDDSNIVNQPTEMGNWDWYTYDDAMKLDLFPPTCEALKQANTLGLLNGNTDRYIPFVQCPKSASEVSIGTPCEYSVIPNDPVFTPVLESPWIVWD